ncbi:MAG: hypothetical protein ACI4HI_06070 [Lachnospiraceae bacterium]
MEEVFEFFKKPINITGKHARMAAEMWEQGCLENSYFSRLIDLYRIAAVVGFRMNRVAEVDHSGDDKKTIFLEQIMREKDNLEFLLQMMRLLESVESGLSKEEAVKKAFRDVDSFEEFAHAEKRFHSYVLGGIEELYERLVQRRVEIGGEYVDEKTSNLVSCIEYFS